VFGLWSGAAQVYSFVINSAVKYSCGWNKSHRAEGHLKKLDARKGYMVDAESVNALLRDIGREGKLEKAESWFAKLQEPLLHPELGGLAPSAAIFDTMTQICAENNDPKRAEKYLEMCLADFKPARASYVKVTEAFLRAKEPRRAQCWMEALVHQGCSHESSYHAAEVKEQRLLLKVDRRWDPCEITDLVLDVVRSLVSSRMTDTAERWLGYLIECGLHPEEPPLADAWEAVRKAKPMNILPARLYSESEYIPARGDPAVQVPALMLGEAPAERPAIEGPPEIVDVKQSLIEQSSNMTARPWSCAHGHRPGAMLQDSQAGLRSTWGGHSTPRSAEGRILLANARRQKRSVAAAMVLTSRSHDKQGALYRAVTLN
jgi:hypothetical protein